MDRTEVIAGSYETLAANMQFRTKADLGDSLIGMYASGCGPMTGTGTVEMVANGQIRAQAGGACFSVTTDITGQSSAYLDGGNLGVVTLACGLPIGNSQTMKLDSLMGAIEISNGNIPGATQKINLDAKTQSIELNAGGLPISPKIEMSPAGIKLSVGPMNSIEITAAGVKIQGLMVGVTGDVSTQVSGGMLSLQGEIEAAVKAPLVMIQ